MRFWSSKIKWLDRGKVGVVYKKAYYKPLPFYFIIRLNEPGVVLEDDGDVWIPGYCFIRYDKKGRPYIVPSNEGNYKIIYDSWSGDRRYEPQKHNNAVFEELGYSHGGGAGEYWAIVPRS